MEELVADRILRELEEIRKEQNNIKDLLNQMMLYNLRPGDFCPAGGEHEYPNPWFATIPPHCKKCGQQAPSNNIIYGTITDGVELKIPDGRSSDAAGFDFNKFGGNMVYSNPPIDSDSTNPITDIDNTQTSTTLII